MRTILNLLTVTEEDLVTMTIGELAKEVPKTYVYHEKTGMIQKFRKPTVEQLKNTEVVLQTVEPDIVVYSNGFLTYTKKCGDKEYSTTVGLDRCAVMVYRFVSEKEERDWDFDTPDTITRFIKQNGGYIREDRVDLSALHWLEAVRLNCEERLMKNQLNRENAMAPVSLQENSAGTCFGASCPDIAEEVAAKEEKRINIERMRDAKKSLTARQHEVIDAYYGNRIVSEARVAKDLDMTQQGVHNILTAAIKKMRKDMNVKVK